MKINLSASPFTFTAPSDGVVVISEGGISDLAFSRSGSDYVNAGCTRGIFSVEAGDNLRITFQDVPLVTFFPSGKGKP